jgi:orotidine-5'-phosphate decarboxylase
MQTKANGKMLMSSFSQRFFQLSDERSPLCLGLDPSRELMRDWGLSDNAEGLRRFCGVVMEAAADRIAVVKPQSGFFERLGPPGLSELARAVANPKPRPLAGGPARRHGPLSGTSMAGC